MEALRMGFHLVIEKPISPSEDECRAIVKLALEKNRQVMVCYVLRYTPFFSKIKNLIHKGNIGRVLSITHNENVGYYHAAHSYVRGNWKSAEESSPMILAKSCHDLDLLLWLADSRCTKISSMGGLTYFRQENAPEGGPDYCQDGCPKADTCPYNSERIYISEDALTWMRVIVFPGEEEGKPRLYDRKADLEILRNSPYGRCVFKCHNNVVDHQAVILEFENGVTASFHMNSCTHDISRTIRINGSLGEIIGNMDKDMIEVYRFGEPAETIHLQLDEETLYGHGGGDFGFMQNVVNVLNGTMQTKTAIENSIESHLLCFAAEKSRLTGKIIEP